jgi:hypothetical protein
LAKQTFQLARCECILRVTSQTSLFTWVHNTNTHTKIIS